MLDKNRHDPVPDGKPVKGRHSTFPLSRIKVADAEEDGRRRIEGYASVFGNRDSYGDIMVQGAFARTLEERLDVKVLYQHDTYQPIGKQEAAYENDFGLVVRGVLTETDMVKGTVLPLLLDGVLTGLSIGYDIVKGQASPDGYLLMDVELFEWSPVTFPANESAQVTEVKTLDSTPSDAHAVTVARATHTLANELEGYFSDSVRWESLQLEPLHRLHQLLGGRLRADAPHAADASDEALVQTFSTGYAAGVEDSLGILSHKE